MHWHPTDEDLILRCFRELPAGEAGRVDAHLAACDACRDGQAELEATLALVDIACIPEPDAGFERAMWARVSEALPVERRWSWRQVVPVGALAAAGIALVALARAPMPDAGPDPSRLALTQKRVLFTALDDHFQQTELLLIELMNAPAADEDGIELGFERETAGDLVASSRLYRATARATGDDPFALVLEDLEHILVEVARSPARLGRPALDVLRQRIGDEDWLFKVRAAASEVRVRQQSLNVLSEGPL